MWRAECAWLSWALSRVSVAADAKAASGEVRDSPAGKTMAVQKERTVSKCIVYVRPAGRGRYSVDLGPHADIVYYTEETLPKCIKYAMAKGEVHTRENLNFEGTKVYVPTDDVDALWPGEGKRDYYHYLRENEREDDKD